MSSYYLSLYELTINNENFINIYKNLKKKFNKCQTVSFNKFNLSIDFIANIKSVTHIIFNAKSDFNKSIIILPVNLKFLILSNDFNQSILNLPCLLSYLKFGNNYNQNNLRLPNLLIGLYLGDQYMCNLPELPNSLIYLLFSSDSCFNHPLNNLPNNLKILSLGSGFNNSLNNLPNSLNRLLANYKNSHNNLCIHHALLPSSLIELNICCRNVLHINYDNLPNITHLYLNQLEKYHNYYDSIKHLPKTLKFLNINYIIYNSELPLLNETLITLKIVGCYNNNIDYLTLHESLKNLIIIGSFNNMVNLLPKTLIKLELGDNFNQEINNLPKTLIKLGLGDKFNQKINKLPKTLIILILGNSFNKSLDNLPNSLQHLEIGSNFKCKINKLPILLKILELNNNYIYTNAIINLLNKQKIKYIFRNY